MKKLFSTLWKASTQPRKQRKYHFNLPMHSRRKLLSVHLSKALREKHGTRSLAVRVGDKVRVLRGTHKGKEGAVKSVDSKRIKVIVEKVEHPKKEGGAAPYPLSPSNLMITEIKSDKRRIKKNQ